jgi:hypothetical protein
MNIMQRRGQNAELSFCTSGASTYCLPPLRRRQAEADSSEVTETGRRYVLNLFRTPWLRALMSERAQATCMPMSSDARRVLRKGYTIMAAAGPCWGAFLFAFFADTCARGIKTMPVKAYFFYHIFRAPLPYIRRIKR